MTAISSVKLLPCFRTSVTLRLPLIMLRDALLLHAFLLLLLIRILGHDIFKQAPERLDRCKFATDLCDFLEGAVQLVDILKNNLKTLGNFCNQQFTLLFVVRAFGRRIYTIGY